MRIHTYIYLSLSLSLSLYIYIYIYIYIQETAFSKHLAQLLFDHSHDEKTRVTMKSEPPIPN